MTGDAASEVHVGIVTALPWECAAVQMFIGDLQYLSVPGDPNNYRAGRMPSKDPFQPHRVVVALQVQDGTRSASALCSDMARSFPELQVFIMCGIAGGVPVVHGSGTPVRLGDVLSATRGVVDYDHVRTVDGKNVLRRSVEGLSKALLRADRELEVKSHVSEEAWLERLDDTARNEGFLSVPRTAEPLELGSGVNNGVPGYRRLFRPTAWPRVHRGAIGSADRLLRDAVLRDALVEEYDILGVEMEGSGIAVGADLHDRHWFMVRGVADYCDNRTKSDNWHPYASLTAAAYVHALLAECAPFGSAMPRISASGRDTRAVGGASPGAATYSLSSLEAIVKALLSLPVLQDDYQRRAVMAQLPVQIRTMVPDNVVARLHVVSLVQTCEGFPDGRDVLLDVLRLALGADSAEFQRVGGVIVDNWSRG